MKLLAVVLAIGFFLLAGAPPAVVAHPVERKASCCMADEQPAQSRMSCHGNSGMQACTCKTHTSPGSSQALPACGGACMAPSALTSQPAGLIFRLKRYAAHGYRRVTGKNILEHDTRREIYGHIIALPGVDLRTLSRLTGLNEHTARYHLEKLHSGGKIRITTIGGVSHCFENHGRYSDDEQILMARMFTSGTGRILKLIDSHPGLTRGELAIYLGVAGPTVTRSVRHLIDDGLIHPERDGRYTRYYPGWQEHHIGSVRVPA